MKLCIFMVGVTERRSKEAKIITSLYKQSGLGVTTMLVPDIASELDVIKQLDNAIKCGMNVIVIDMHLMTDEERLPYLNTLDGKYEIQYRITDTGTHILPEGADVKRV